MREELASSIVLRFFLGVFRVGTNVSDPEFLAEIDTDKLAIPIFVIYLESNVFTSINQQVQFRNRIRLTHTLLVLFVKKLFVSRLNRLILLLDLSVNMFLLNRLIVGVNVWFDILF